MEIPEGNLVIGTSDRVAHTVSEEPRMVLLRQL